MRIAYIISAYKSPDQLIRLVRRLHTPRSIFLIHVDKRTNTAQYQDMVSGVNHLANVVFLKRHSCHWGDFGHVRATLKGLAYLFATEIEFDYLCLLTGQDYPIKSNSYIESFLTTASGTEFIACYSPPNQYWGDEVIARRTELWHFRFLEDWPLKTLHAVAHLPTPREFESKIKSIIYSSINAIFSKRTPPANTRLFGGPGYWCITRQCGAYVHRFVSENPSFVKFFKYVDIPDEIFFHTIILNSPFARKVVNDDLRCIDISDGRGPRIWRQRDLETLTRSRALIARKFDTTVDSEILDLIDSKLAVECAGVSLMRGSQAK